MRRVRRTFHSRRVERRTLALRALWAGEVPGRCWSRVDREAVLSEATRIAPRVALTRAEAAECLGVSLDSFERWVQPELRLVRRGRLRLVAVRDLERWVEANAAKVIDLPRVPSTRLAAFSWFDRVF